VAQKAPKKKRARARPRPRHAAQAAQTAVDHESKAAGGGDGDEEEEEEKKKKKTPKGRKPKGGAAAANEGKLQIFNHQSLPVHRLWTFSIDELKRTPNTWITRPTLKRAAKLHFNDDGARPFDGIVGFSTKPSGDCVTNKACSCAVTDGPCSCCTWPEPTVMLRKRRQDATSASTLSLMWRIGKKTTKPRRKASSD
jgi:hypothetical protein